MYEHVLKSQSVIMLVLSMKLEFTINYDKLSAAKFNTYSSTNFPIVRLMNFNLPDFPKVEGKLFLVGSVPENPFQKNARTAAII